MTNHESSEIDQVFLETIERPLNERSAFLDRRCEGLDPLVREEVQKLLEADRDASEADLTASAPRLDVAKFLASTYDGGSSEDVGSVIGPYRLLQKLGEGGMGSVYMAEQKQPVRRRVALKVIKPGMDSKQVVARFEAERQALAMMDHPNIAKVLEVGTTDAGRPYFVMELVMGIPITRFCEEKRLTISERLKLFISVCQAVQHAHQKGVIHRDLKPSNILVAEYDSATVPKIIDFGLAKATHQQLTEKTLFTNFGQVVGTFQYMSPEQAKMNQLDIDTRSDIYSLGVVLYELLTGCTPLDAKTLRAAAFDEMLRLIREADPPRPSTRLSHSPESSATAESCQTEPKKLSLLLRGDLDAIVMKALEKERDRRYDTSTALAEDVQRFIDHEPVKASPASTIYYLRRFVRRNRTVVATVAGVFLLLASASGITAWFWYEAIKANDVIKQQRDKIGKQNDQLNRHLKKSYAASMVTAGHISQEISGLSTVEEMTASWSPESEDEEDQRGWEWFFLRSRLLQPVEQYESATGVWTESGLRLARRCNDGSYTVSDAESGEIVGGLPEGSVPSNSQVALSPDTSYLFTRREDGTVHIHNLARDDDFPSQQSDEQLLPYHWTWLQRVRWSPDGRRVANFHGDSVEIFDSANSELIASLPTEAWRMIWSPDASRLAITSIQSGSFGIKIWDTETGKSIDLPELPAIVRIGAQPAAWSPDGSSIAVGVVDGFDVLILDANTGRQQQKLENGGGAPNRLAWSPDGKTLAMGGLDRSVRLWNMETGEVTGILRGHQSPIWRVDWRPDSSQLVTTDFDFSVKVWNVGPNHMPDLFGRTALTEGLYSEGMDFMGWSADGSRFATRNANQNIVRVWDLKSRQRLLDMPEPGSQWYATPFAWSPNSDRIATNTMTSTQATIGLWDIRTNQQTEIPIRGASGIWDLKWSPDGRRLASCSRDDKIRIWDTSSGNSDCTLTELNNTIDHVSWHIDGVLLAAAGIQGIRIWDTRSEQVVHQIPGTESGRTGDQECLHIAWSPDGAFLVAGNDERVKIWDGKTFEKLHDFRAHSDWVDSISWSPDGSRFITGSRDTTAKVWDSRTGLEVLTLAGHANGPVNVFWSPDGQRIVTSEGKYGDGIYLWDASKAYSAESEMRSNERQ